MRGREAWGAVQEAAETRQVRWRADLSPQAPERHLMPEQAVLGPAWSPWTWREEGCIGGGEASPQLSLSVARWSFPHPGAVWLNAQGVLVCGTQQRGRFLCFLCQGGAAEGWAGGACGCPPLRLCRSGPEPCGWHLPSSPGLAFLGPWWTPWVGGALLGSCSAGVSGAAPLLQGPAGPAPPGWLCRFWLFGSLFG